jgi:hypothetical protein
MMKIARGIGDAPNIEVISLQQTHNLVEERDAFEQELYESNRYAAFLERERLRLSERERVLSERIALVEIENRRLSERERVLSERIALVEIENRRLSEYVDLLLGSTSWQSTSPLRKLVSFARRLRSNKPSVPGQVRRDGPKVAPAG